MLKSLTKISTKKYFKNIKHRLNKKIIFLKAFEDRFLKSQTLMSSMHILKIKPVTIHLLENLKKIHAKIKMKNLS